MKEWKMQIVEELGKRAESLREINFKEVANECGYKHVKTQEVKEIAARFLKDHPTYRAVRMVKNPDKASSTESLFTTLVLTELEYESEEEFLEERDMSEIEFDEEKLKTAVCDFNQWQGDAVIMCDTEDGTVWTDVFAGSSDWKEYHSDTIHSITSKRGLDARDNKVSFRAVKELLDAGAYKYASADEMPNEVLAIYMRYGL